MQRQPRTREQLGAIVALGPRLQQRSGCNGAGSARERFRLDAALIGAYRPTAGPSRNEVHVGASLERRIVPKEPPSTLDVYVEADTADCAKAGDVTFVAFLRNVS